MIKRSETQSRIRNDSCYKVRAKKKMSFLKSDTSAIPDVSKVMAKTEILS